MELRPLSLADMEQVRIWRNGCRETLRTPYMLTAEMQEDYYRNVICDRRSMTRYWGLWEKCEIPVVGYPPHKIGSMTFVGYGGLENIEWENSTAEISLLIAPEYRRKGYGRTAVDYFLHEAFDNMGLHSVHGECYECAPWQFWKILIDARTDNAFGTWIPARKYWENVYWRSYYFIFFAPNVFYAHGGYIKK